MPDEQGEIEGKTPQDRTESQGDRPDHVPYAQMGKEQKKREAPDIGSHSAGGQGLSG
ncbi:MAG TPA: hypothetical protein VFH78_15020 [Candidatus Thermoplasmatota archaeon]|nr:hypothetical protein [Candidatus Thermoplasmatota archaeon]